MSKHPSLRRAAGFTLLELMIVVGIIAILSAIAIPVYTEYVIRSKLTDATNALSAYRVSMEQYYQDNRTYTSGGTCGVASPTLNYFTLNCAPAASSTSGYTAKAVGIAGTQVAGFTYSIDNFNNRQTLSTATGWGGTNTACWIMRKGGGC
ncbi:type IV pilin protein [Dyella sp. GSA-30]|uniref:type IV pilin protein n=1 Tax=Dyella sp. GSA-30 TaxID=2994496 RepID=UPI0024903A24|nr:type IV pilin protein [Dyella sp. GSA-30]BDU21769.1 hypothetical protein DYGSA30_32260 [Dyella sp. GSA-30]